MSVLEIIKEPDQFLEKSLTKFQKLTMILER